MAQTMIQSTLLKLGKLSLAPKHNYIAAFTSSTARKYSTSTDAKKPKQKHIEKSVFISQSNDVFSNLALEDWMYRNFDFTNHQILLLWCNSPCVVVGRHQNPWVEANVSQLMDQGITLARRNSGGGTVYHDNGNLNLTFFTSRDKYYRRQNLEIVSRALNREWGIETEISPREDIILKLKENYKISGTASKLGRPNAYHHCTLLVDVDVSNLHGALHGDRKSITSNATQSVSSAVMNLSKMNSKITVERLMTAVGWEYMRTKQDGADGGQEEVSKQRGFQMINPGDDWFPGLNQLRDDLSDWTWRFGKTPKFTVARTFPIPSDLIGDQSPLVGNQELTIEIEVAQGKVDDVRIKIPPSFIGGPAGLHGNVDVVTSLKGMKFSEEAVQMIEDVFVNKQPKDGRIKHQFVANCMREAMRSV